MVNKKDLEDLKDFMSGKFVETKEHFNTKIDSLNQKYDELLKETRESREVVDSKISTLEQNQEVIMHDLTEQDDRISALESLKVDYEKKMAMMESVIQKNNLRFHGVKTQGTSTTLTITHFLKNDLQMASEFVDNIEILDCFRIGKPDPAKGTDTRTILVKFSRTSDVHAIITAARKKPKGTPGGVSEDLPASWAATRRQFHKKYIQPARQQLGADKVKVKWQQDVLFINSIKINPEDSWATVKQKLQ